MNEQKTIYACYEEIKQREISELKDAVKAHGGKFVFDPDVNAPEVLCNLKYGGPADVRIMSVSIDDQGFLTIIGQEHGKSGCSDWYESEEEIGLSDIAYGHIEFITSEIVRNNKRKENLLLEIIVQLSADIYKQVYDHCECYTEASAEIIRLAREFEKELNWQEDDERDYIVELEKFENEYLESIKD